MAWGIFWRVLLSEIFASMGLMAVFLVTPLKPVLYDGRLVLWHPTIAFAWFALLLLGSLLHSGNGLLYLAWGRLLSQPKSFWRQLHAWTGSFYFVLAIANIGIAHALPFRTWLQVKTLGLLVALIGFSILAARYFPNARPAEASV